MAQSAIEWTEATWNPVTGCDKVSPGCKYCYAEVMARRLKGMGQPNYRDGFKLTLQPHMLDRPLSWRRPQMIFVNSMSDLLHASVPTSFIAKVFATISSAHWHTFQVLTKRAERLEEIASSLPWPANLWMGVSVERDDYAFRIDHLSNAAARGSRSSSSSGVGGTKAHRQAPERADLGRDASPEARTSGGVARSTHLE